MWLVLVFSAHTESKCRVLDAVRLLQFVTLVGLSRQEARRNLFDYAAMDPCREKEKRTRQRLLWPLQHPQCLARPPLGLKLRGVRSQARHPPPASQGHGQTSAPSFAKRIKELFQPTSLWPIRRPFPLSARCAPPHACEVSKYLYPPRHLLPLAWLRLSLSTHQDLRLTTTQAVRQSSCQATSMKFVGRQAALRAASSRGTAKLRMGSNFLVARACVLGLVMTVLGQYFIKCPRAEPVSSCQRPPKRGFHVRHQLARAASCRPPTNRVSLTRGQEISAAPHLLSCCALLRNATVCTESIAEDISTASQAAPARHTAGTIHSSRAKCLSLRYIATCECPPGHAVRRRSVARRNRWIPALLHRDESLSCPGDTMTTSPFRLSSAHRSSYKTSCPGFFRLPTRPGAVPGQTYGRW